MFCWQLVWNQRILSYSSTWTDLYAKPAYAASWRLRLPPWTPWLQTPDQRLPRWCQRPCLTRRLRCCLLQSAENRVSLLFRAILFMRFTIKIKCSLDIIIGISCWIMTSILHEWHPHKMNDFWNIQIESNHNDVDVFHTLEYLLPYVLTTDLSFYM